MTLSYEALRHVPNLGDDDKEHRLTRCVQWDFAGNKDLHETYRRVFSGDDGERVLRHLLLTLCASERTPYSPKGVEQTHINIGKQLVALEVKDILFGNVVKKEDYYNEQRSTSR